MLLWGSAVGYSPQQSKSTTNDSAFINTQKVPVFSITLSSELSALGCARSISPCSLIWVHEAGIQNTNQLWEPGKKAVTLNGIQIRAVRIWESPSSKHDLLGWKGGGETVPKLLDSEAWRKLGRSVRYWNCEAWLELNLYRGIFSQGKKPSKLFSWIQTQITSSRRVCSPPYCLGLDACSSQRNLAVAEGNGNHSPKRWALCATLHTKCCLACSAGLGLKLPPNQTAKF